MTGSTPKTKSLQYQDYVIRDGKLIGEFDQLYRDFDDPWGQKVEEETAPDKIIGLELISRLRESGQVRKVLELGCGLGHFTSRIAKTGVEVMGVDISEVAISRARSTYPGIEFRHGNALSFALFEEFTPDLFVMAEVTWYLLESLDQFLSWYRKNLPNTWLFHTLTTYEPGVQKYGVEKFTNLDGIMKYFGMKYVEWGQLTKQELIHTPRTYFLGHW